MSTIDSTSTPQRDVYRNVTDAIINAIDQGVSNWRMPWHTSGRFAFSPINVTSRKPYRYDSGEWATYQQWQERGAQVRTGEKSTTVVFWKLASDAGESDDCESRPSSRLLFTRGYAVFNAAQVEGYTPKQEADVPMPERIAHAEASFASIGLNVSTASLRDTCPVTVDGLVFMETVRDEAIKSLALKTTTGVFGHVCHSPMDFTIERRDDVLWVTTQGFASGITSEFG